MPVVRYVRGRESEPTPNTVILTLAEAKQQLRITTDDADAIVTTAIGAAVAFVADTTNLSWADIAASPTLRMAVIVATREFYNGYSEIPPLHAIWALMNAGATACK